MPTFAQLQPYMTMIAVIFFPMILASAVIQRMKVSRYLAREPRRSGDYYRLIYLGLAGGLVALGWYLFVEGGTWGDPSLNAFLTASVIGLVIGLAGPYLWGVFIAYMMGSQSAGLNNLGKALVLHYPEMEGRARSGARVTILGGFGVIHEEHAMASDDEIVARVVDKPAPKVAKKVAKKATKKVAKKATKKVTKKVAKKVAKKRGKKQ